MATTINYNGTEIIISANYVDDAKPWGDYVKRHHEVEVTIGDEAISFDFYCNDYDLDEKGLREAFYFFLSDGIAYANAQDIDDFDSEFGYDKVSALLKAWHGCKDAYEKWQGFSGIDIYDLCNWMQDEYDI